MQDKIIKVTEEVEKATDFSGIVGLISSAASIFWGCAEFRDDFCLKAAGIGRIVFGKENRVSWNYDIGFVIDEEDCTPEFVLWNRVNNPTIYRSTSVEKA